MKNSMKLTINKFGSINTAEINLGKVTVVGGKNASCKSTVSKLLFSFLKYNSSKRKKIVHEDIINQIVTFLFKLNQYAKADSNTVEHDFFEDFNKITDEKIDYKTKFNIYQNLKVIYSQIGFNPSIKEELDSMIIRIDSLSNMANIDNSEIYASIMRKLLKSEFSNSAFCGNAKLEGVFKEIQYEFSFDFSENDFNSDESFKHQGLYSIPDVFYIDSFSMFDLNDSKGLQNTDHYKFLKENINPDADESDKLFDEKRYGKHMNIEKRIQEMICGELMFNGSNFIYTNDNNEQFFMKDTASGIKQIGIIQLLLSYRKLKENSFLIIDEPEVNLHPEWQFKLANILILLAKSLNISVYINSHSPLFIEALDTFAYYYDMSGEVKYHLAEASHNAFSFDICEVDEENLSKIYDNLGKAYLDMDVLRLEKDID